MGCKSEMINVNACYGKMDEISFPIFCIFYRNEENGIGKKKKGKKEKKRRVEILTSILFNLFLISII